jgi:hypothetical protein
MSVRPLRHRSVVSIFVVSALLAAFASLPASAQCPGDCGADLLSAPKQVERFVKASTKAIGKCAKKADPVCPTACSLPDPEADPYFLSASCATLVQCEVAALAELSLGASWDDVGFCASAEAEDCGNARIKNAGKLVSKKIKRRRTGKMDKFAADETKCGEKIDKKGACDGPALCGVAAEWVDDVLPVSIPKNGTQLLDFSVSAAGEGVAVLTMSAESADWSIEGRESVVLDYAVDGVPLGQIVVFNGADSTDYRTLLGPLTAGDHVLSLKHNTKITPAKDSAVLVEAQVAVSVVEPGDGEYDAIRFAPYLRGIDRKLNRVTIPDNHPGNAVSDVPVVEYVRAVPGAGKTTYRYVMIWSNEDGGTGLFPDSMLARWGRTTDVETYVEVDVLDGGILDEIRFRPDESGTLKVFAGDLFLGTHPMIRTSTANGLVEDDGESTINFLPVPFSFDDSGVPRERGMNLDPVSYVAMAKEMIREGKTEVDPNNPDGKFASDLRNYLFFEYNIDVSAGGDVLAAYAVVDGTTYRSDHFLEVVGVFGTLISGGFRWCAIELPSGTAISDITEVGMVGVQGMSGTLFAIDAFMLDADFLPTTERIQFSGSQFQLGGSPVWSVPVTP